MGGGCSHQPHRTPGCVDGAAQHVDQRVDLDVRHDQGPREDGAGPGCPTIMPFPGLARAMAADGGVSPKAAFPDGRRRQLQRGDHAAALDLADHRMAAEAFSRAALELAAGAAGGASHDAPFVQDAQVCEHHGRRNEMAPAGECVARCAALLGQRAGNAARQR